MAIDGLSDIVAFLAVARERSFTKAAAQLGLSPSALSHTVRRLEERLGVRLLMRTTRSVTTTDAGDQLVETAGPHVEGIDQALTRLGEFRGQPAGLLRITTGDHAAEERILPAVTMLLARHPALRVEISVDLGLVDIVAERFDAGVRLGETIAQDMVAVKIGPDMEMAAVASPAYFQRAGMPRTPHDLSSHNCINLRFPTYGGLYAWEFERDGRPLNVRVQGQLTVNDIALARNAAVAGQGIAYLPEEYVADEIGDGALVRVLGDWCPPFPGYHLYYPSRRQQSPAMAALVEALRFR
ncbi:MAG: LysR family transcriptional regulator [Sphingomonadales bacterium]|nr:LysR family transcriptional regulator [Sphingomonadales bacterium]